MHFMLLSIYDAVKISARVKIFSGNHSFEAIAIY